jgi:hypothetical protein
MAATLALTGAAAGALAEPLPPPTGPVILTVTGSIDNRNTESGAQFDLEMLEALGTTELRTSTSWTEGTPVFEGVLGRRLLDAVGARGARAVGRALNDYSIAIPLSDFRDLPLLLALKMNGQYLKVRDGGPIWIIYPWDQHPELVNEETKQKSIWQLTELQVE